MFFTFIICAICTIFWASDVKTKDDLKLTVSLVFAACAGFMLGMLITLNKLPALGCQL